jgi:hypothetical protein
MAAALELQAAIVAALKASAEVAAIVGARVYDNVPRAADEITATFPFVALSGWQSITEDAECVDGEDITVTLDVWSRAVGMPEAHRLAAAVKAALHNAELILDETALVSIEHESTLTLRDPDGLTTHAVLDFRAFVETP